ncbi:MAG: 50S ribosomal protein L6 [Polyangiaceae bacterium]
MATEVKDLRNSRVGKRPVVLPKGVTATLANGVIKIKGGKGELSRKLPPNVNVTVDATGITVVPTIGGRDGARFQGLTRALINGMVIGTSEGFTKTMELKGTGYRAELKGQVLNLSLGLSHPVNFPLPQGLKVEIPGDSKGTVIILSCSDKEVLGQAAAKIRGFRPPSPYGGKGVRFRGEKVREKAGKAAGGKGK